MTVDEDGFVTCEIDSTFSLGGGENVYLLVKDNNQLSPDKEYNVVLEIKDRENIDYINLTDTVGSYNPKYYVEIPHVVQDINPLTFIDMIFPSGNEESDCLMLVSITSKEGTIGKVSFRLSILEYDEELSEDNFVYEK